MAYPQGNLTIISNIPRPPPAFLNLTPDDPGFYLTGHYQYTARRIHLVSIFHRQLGQYEDFLLALLSVVLIAVLSDIVTTVLLRRRRRANLPPSVIRAACLLDEAAHFRALPRLLFRRRPSTHADRRAAAAAGLHSPRRELLTHIAVLCMAAVLFLADVTSVALTQPSDTHSSANTYNLAGLHPVGTTRGTAKFIRRLSGNDGCTTPTARDTITAHNYFLSACHVYEANDAPNATAATSITVTTLFHSGGADHTVSASTASVTVSIRAKILLATGEGGPRHILFSSLDDANHSHAAFLHRRTAYAAVEWTCNRGEPRYTCVTQAAELRAERVVEVRREVRLWRGVEDDVKENATGLQTIFSVLPLVNPFRSINNAMHVLAASTAVQEVEQSARYARVLTDAYEDGIPGLLSEQGRLAGIVPLGMAVTGMMALLFLLRAVLRPASLAEVARDRVRDGLPLPVGFAEPGDGLWEERGGGRGRGRGRGRGSGGGAAFEREVDEAMRDRKKRRQESDCWSSDDVWRSSATFGGGVCSSTDSFRW